MDDQVEKLEAEYCPPLDTAVLLAIISDYDLTDQSALADARTILDSIKADAEIEQATEDFNDVATLEAVLDDSAATSSSRVGSEATDVTGASPPPTGDHIQDEACLESLDDDTKIALLQDCFPSLGEHTVSHTLKKCSFNWRRAVDELLNITAFGDLEGHDGVGISAKGIDAFSEDQAVKRGRKKKPKGSNHKLQFDDTTTTASQATSPWKSAVGDVDFLVRHTQLSPVTVRSAYNANGSSIPQTISHLLNDMVNSAAKVTSTNSTIQANAVELGQDFPSISSEHLTALIQLTHPSTSAAHALARALVQKSPSVNGDSSGPIVPRYKALSLTDGDTSATSTSRSTTTFSTPDLTTSRALALSHRDAHRLLSSQAAAAYRRSRSNHLYGGAAAYYASQARDSATSAAAHSSAAAEAHVAAQSTREQLDLHGTVVADAVRIAARETAAWWSGLGEARLGGGRAGAAEREKGFRIVVGLGRHSEGGRSRIGPAVHRALVAEGWRVEQGSGVLTVRGKARA